MSALIPPPLVLFLLPLTLITAMVMALVLFILRGGWLGYRGLAGAAVFLVLVFGPLRLLLTGAFSTVWLLGATANIEVILWAGLVLSVVAIFVLAFLTRRVATDKEDKSGQM